MCLLGGQNDVASGDLDVIACCGSVGVSRRHALLLIGADAGVSAQGAGSANGTFVNGERLMLLASRLLREGDLLALGRDETAWFKFVAGR